MIPLFHDFRDELVIIFGGGQVAARKVARFGREADVVVVSNTFHERLDELSCDRIRADIGENLVEQLVADAFLVIPATDDQDLNDRIATSASEAGSLVNPVDRVGDTITPSTVEGSNLSIAISTGGKSPAISKYLRRRLEPEIERADAMIDIQSALRAELSERPESDRRDRLWRVLEDERVWDAIADGNTERAESLAREHL